MTETSARVLIYAPSFHPAVEAGGPARDLTNLVDRIEGEHSVVVITPDRDLSGARLTGVTPGLPVARGRARIHYVSPDRPRELLRLMQRAASSRPDITLINSVWNPRFSLLPALLRTATRDRAGVFALMPRGELEAGALHLKRRKKRTAMPLVQRLYGGVVTVCAATSDSEAANLSAWNPRLPVLRVSETPDAVPYGAPRHRGAVARFLFLGRIHPTKGLVEFLTATAETTAPMRVDVAGPVGDQSYWKKCQDLARAQPRNVEIRFLGPVARDEVAGLLHEHDALVCLTAGENFGHTFAEALQAGCPVAATPPTPWTPTLQAGGGWVVPDRNDAGAVAALLDSIAQSDASDHLARRRAARAAYESWSRSTPPHVIDQILTWRDTEKRA